MAETTTATVTTAARGKVTAIKDGMVHFAPTGTNYELHLAAPGYAGTAGAMTQGTIHLVARKVWTVPSGGNFISPIFGTPRTVQGMIRAIADRSIVVHAGVPMVVELPAAESGYDLANGALRVGVMVNVMAMPGARFEAAPAAR
jgi:energy-converting hydrogenase Eha subunit B